MSAADVAATLRLDGAGRYGRTSAALTGALVAAREREAVEA